MAPIGDVLYHEEDEATAWEIENRRLGPLPTLASVLAPGAAVWLAHPSSTRLSALDTARPALRDVGAQPTARVVLPRITRPPCHAREIDVPPVVGPAARTAHQLHGTPLPTGATAVLRETAAVLEEMVRTRAGDGALSPARA